MEEYIQVFTATEKKKDAEKIARALVRKGLAGCIQIGGQHKYLKLLLAPISR